MTTRQLRGTSHADPETRRQELISAAITCFARQGYKGTTIDKIAVQAGLSKGSVYRFFTTKDDVLLGVLDKFESDIRCRIAQSDTDKGALSSLEHVLAEMLVYLGEHQALAAVWMEFYTHPKAKVRYLKTFNDFRSELMTLLLLAFESGETLSPPDEGAVDAIMSMLEGLLVLVNVDPSVSAVNRFNRAWPVLARGLKGGAD